MNNVINLFDWGNSKKPVGESKPSTYDRVEKLCKRLLGVPQGVLFSTATTKEDLWMDSLDEVELLMWVEEEFDIDIPDEEWEKCNTIGDVVELVDGKL